MSKGQWQSQHGEGTGGGRSSSNDALDQGPKPQITSPRALTSFPRPRGPTRVLLRVRSELRLGTELHSTTAPPASEAGGQ